MHLQNNWINKWFLSFYFQMIKPKLYRNIFSLFFFSYYCSPIKRLRAMATSDRRPLLLPNRNSLLLPQFWLKNRLLLPNRNFSMSNATQCIPYPHQTIILILNAVLKSYYNSLPYHVNYIFNFYFIH